MANVIDSLVVEIGTRVDKGGFSQARKGFLNLRNAAKAFAAVWAGGQIVSAVRDIAEASASVGEAAALNNQIFGDGVEALNKWSNASAEAFGLSRFELRELAGQLGIVIANYTRTTGEAQRLSSTLTDRAADIARATNGRLTDVVRDLRSALTGSSEVVEKYGVNIKVAGLEQEALRQGITKSVANMSEQEKLQLRINTIMRQTARFQGAAAAETGTYAGQVAALQAAFFDLRVAIGQSGLLGAVTAILFTLRTLVSSITEQVTRFRQWAAVAENAETVMSALRAALFGLGTVALALVILQLKAAVIAALPFLAVGAALTAAIVLVGIVLEDLWVYFNDGQSVTGELIKAWNTWLDKLEQTNPWLAKILRTMGLLVTGPYRLAVDFTWALVDAFSNLLDGNMSFQGLLGPLIDFAKKWARPLTDLFGSIGKVVGKGIDLAGEGITAGIQAAANVFGPVPSLSGGSSSSTSVEVGSINVANPNADAQEIARSVADEIEARQQRQISDAFASEAG